MNWSTAILLLLAWQLLSNNTKSAPKIQDIAPFLNDDTRGILDGVTKLSSPTATSEDKTGAIFQMMTNPTVMSFAQNLFGGDNGDTSTGSTQPPPAPQTPPTPQTSTPLSAPETPTPSTYSGQFNSHATTQPWGGTPSPQFAPQANPSQGMERPQYGQFAQQTNHAQGSGFSARQTPESPTQPQDYQNDEGYTFPSPSERAKQFFAPIDTIATAEIKHKLCYFYDNWYLAK